MNSELAFQLDIISKLRVYYTFFADNFFTY